MADAAKARVNRPKQRRSRDTLERIVSASLELLATEGLAGLTVQRVVERADSSVGSFYARFSGKDDLLAYLGERVWEEAIERWEGALATRDWRSLEIAEVASAAAGLLFDAQRSRAAYLRALDWASGKPGLAYERFRTRLIEGLGDALLLHADRMRCSDPQLSIKIGLRAILGVIDGEFRTPGERLDRDVVVRECATLLTGYLTGSDLGPSNGGAVDFFDVWG